MAEEKMTVIVDIKTTADNAAEEIIKLNKELAACKTKQKELTAENKESTAEYARNEAEIKNVQAALRKQRTILGEAMKLETKNEKSLNDLRSELKLVTIAYDDLTKAEQKGAKGKDYQDKIKKLTIEVTKLEEETGRFQRNVGNYENAMRSAINTSNPMLSFLVKVQTESSAAGGFFKSLGSNIKAMTKAAMSFIATPIGATIAAITVVIKAVSSGIKSSEENTNKWREITAKFQPILDLFTKALQGVASVVLTVVDTFMSGYTAVLQFFGLIDKESGGEIERYNKLSKAQEDYAKQCRENIVANAKDESEAAELRNKAADKDKYTAEERIDFLEQAAQKEKEIAERNKKEAEEKLRILQEEAAATENTAEMNQKLAEAEADVYKATAQYNQRTREITTQLNTAKNEIANEDKKRAEEAKKRAQERAQAEKEAAEKEKKEIQAVADARIALMDEGVEKDIAAENERYARAVEVLRARLQTEANLTEAARAAINEQIELEEENHQQRLTDIQSAEAAKRNEALQSSMDAISGMLQKTTEEQIGEVNKTYEEAYAKIEEMRSNMEPPERIGFATDEEFEEAKDRYDTFMLNLCATETRLREQQADAVVKIEKEKQDNLKKQEADRIAEQLAPHKEALDHELLWAEDNAQAQYDAKMKYLNAELEAVKGNADAEKRVYDQMAEAKKELLDKQMAEFQKYAGGILNAMSAVNDALNAQDEARLEKMEEDYEEEKEALQAKLDAGLISQEEHDAELARLDKDLDAKKTAIEREQAKREKAQAIFSILIQTAAAITEALPNIPLAILAGVMGAAQLAAVKAQPLPKAARGMYIKGKRHSQGGELIEVEDGEIIMNRRSVQMFGPQLSAMSVAGGGVPFSLPDGGYAVRHSGGMANPAGNGIDISDVITQTARAVRASMAETLSETLRGTKIYTAVEDIRRGEKQYSEIENSLTL